MEYFIEKPIYETDNGAMVGVYAKRVNDCIKRKQSLTLTTKWKGLRIYEAFSPKWIKDNCKKIEKVYLRPNEPMILFEVFIKNTFANF
jgi:hypothetical protein